MTLDLPLQTVVSLFAAFSPAEPSEVSGEIGRASDLIGAEVVDAKDEAHAEIVDLMIDAERERVACAVVRCDETVGAEELDFAVPIGTLRFTIDEDGTRHVLLGKEMLTAQERFPRGTYDVIARLRLEGVSTSTTLHRASELRGTTIENPVGESLGEIEDFVVDLEDGDVPFAVVAVGGVLGLGEERHPVPLAALRMPSPVADADDVPMERENRILILDVSREQLESAPRVPRDGLPETLDAGYVANLRRHYGGQRNIDLAFADGVLVELASEHIGRSVTDATGEEIGSVEDLVVDRATGQVEYVVVASGGVLGVGARQVLVPRGVLSPSPDGERLTLDVTEATLETGVEFDEELVPKLSDPKVCAAVERPFLVEENVARGIRPVLVSDLIDRDLEAADEDRKIGEVRDLAIDPRTGDVRYAVVVLTAADDELFAVRWKELHPGTETAGVKLDVDPATVRAERSFPKHAWPGVPMERRTEGQR